MVQAHGSAANGCAKRQSKGYKRGVMGAGVLQPWAQHVLITLPALASKVVQHCTGGEWVRIKENGASANGLSRTAQHGVNRGCMDPEGRKWGQRVKRLSKGAPCMQCGKIGACIGLCSVSVSFV